MYRKIVVPLDGSTAAEAVLDHVRKIAGRSTEVVLVRIAAKPAYEYTLQEAQLSACLDEDAAKEAGRYLSRVAASLRQSGLDVSACVLPEQGPAARILEDFAHKAKADLIAISAHGKPGLIGRLMGSVAERIVHHGHIPVLLVHP